LVRHILSLDVEPGAPLRRKAAEGGRSARAERDAIKACGLWSDWPTALKERFEALAKAAPLTIEDIRAEPWSQGMEAPVIASLMSVLTANQLQAFIADDLLRSGSTVHLVAPLSKEEWAGGGRVIRMHIRAARFHTPIENHLQELDTLLWSYPVHARACLKRAFADTVSKGGWLQAKYHAGGLQSLVKAILEEADSPLLKREIMAKVQEAAGAGGVDAEAFVKALSKFGALKPNGRFVLRTRRWKLHKRFRIPATGAMRTTPETVLAA